MATREGALWVALFVTAILVASVLRVVGLNSGLWYDEIVTLVLSARRPIPAIVTDFAGINTHPLYSVLAHVSIAAFGDSAWALRLPAAAFGVASVAMTYVLARRLTTPAEAWAGATVLATSYHHIWFSQNARGYTLVGFLTLLSTFLLLRARDTGRPRDYVLYASACVAGTYTHLSMALVIAGHVIAVVAGRLARWHVPTAAPIQPLLAAWTGAALVSAILYAPFTFDLLTELRSDAPRAAQIATTRWAFGELIQSVVSGAGVTAVAIAGALAVIGMVTMWQRQRFALSLLLAPAGVTAAAIIVLGQPMRPRFFFFVSGAVAIFVGRGIGVLADAVNLSGSPRRLAARTAIVVAATCALAALSAPALATYYRLPKQDFAGAVRFLEGVEQQGTHVSMAGPACLPLQTYYRKEWPCLSSVEDLHQVGTTSSHAVVVYTLAEYIEDAHLANQLQTNCSLLQRFAGTLNGGDLMICEPHPEDRR